MKYKDFEEFVEYKCPDSGTGGADGAQEAYESWVGNLDAQEVWDFAEEWGEYQYKKGRGELNEVLPDLSNEVI